LGCRIQRFYFEHSGQTVFPFFLTGLLIYCIEKNPSQPLPYVIYLAFGWLMRPFPLPTVESYALIYSIIPLTGEIPAIIMQHSRGEFAICSSQSTKRLQKTGMSNPTQKVVSHGSIL
jgi:hypothetical protein